MRAMIDVGIATGLPREPFTRLFTQGMIRMGGSKMSKSKGNLVAPEQNYATVGADGLRLFHLFVGPPDEDFDWTDQTSDIIDGCGRFLDRLYRLATLRDITVRDEALPEDAEIRRAVHRTIDKVTRDFEQWRFNTAVAALMELVNTVGKWARDAAGAQREVLNEAIDTILLLMAPMAPHLPAELWQQRHGPQARVHATPWPVAEPELLREATVTVASWPALRVPSISSRERRRGALVARRSVGDRGTTPIRPTGS